MPPWHRYRVKAICLARTGVKGAKGELVGLLAGVAVAARVTTLVGGVVGVDISVVKSAVSTVRLAVLVEEVRVEHVAGSVRPETLELSGSLVGRVLGNSVVGAELGVERTGEELAAHPVVGCVDGLALAVGGRRPASTVVGVGTRRSSRNSDVGLVPAGRASDDNLELLAHLTNVGGRGSIKVGTPESALVRGHGSRVRAPVTPDSRCGAVVGRRSNRGVSLDVKVEGSAEGSAVAKCSALGSIVGLKSVKPNVGLGAGRGVQILEGLLVSLGDSAGGGGGSNRSRSSRGHGVERCVGVESRDSVRGRNGAVSIRLGSTRVLGVDEPAVGAFLGGCGASGGG